MYTFYAKVDANGVITDRIQYGGKYNVHYPNGVESDWIEIPDGTGPDFIYDGTNWVAPEDTRTYSQKRAAEYPTWQDQMDMQYHDLVDTTTTWKDAIEAVKTKHPKT